MSNLSFSYTHYIPWEEKNNIIPFLKRNIFPTYTVDPVYLCIFSDFSLFF